MTYLISRTDSIGDVILTLPLCGYLKDFDPGCKIIFLCTSYTKPVVACCDYVDDIIVWDEIEKMDEIKIIAFLKNKGINIVIHVFPVKKIARLCLKAGIEKRIGTSHRWWHWYTVNQRIHFSRKKSNLHEAQLNLMLISKLIGRQNFPMQEVAAHIGFNKIPMLDEKFERIIDNEKVNIIIHPKSQGSAREWPLEKFAEMINCLPASKFRFLISGTEKERVFTTALLNLCEGDVLDISGMLSLTQFIGLISKCDFLVANSTGPLHIASALGLHTVGLYPPMRPIHPGRWAPLGKHVKIFCADKICSDCRKNSICHCIRDINALHVAEYIRSQSK